MKTEPERTKVPVGIYKNYNTVYLVVTVFFNLMRFATTSVKNIYIRNLFENCSCLIFYSLDLDPNKA